MINPGTFFRKHRDIPVALAYLAPSIIIFSVFVFFPLVFSIYLSFNKWDMISPKSVFVGLGNFEHLFLMTASF